MKNVKLSFFLAIVAIAGSISYAQLDLNPACIPLGEGSVTCIDNVCAPASEGLMVTVTTWYDGNDRCIRFESIASAETCIPNGRAMTQDQFIHEVELYFSGTNWCSLIGADAGNISGAAPASPLVQQNVQTFETRVFSKRAVPRSILESRAGMGAGTAGMTGTTGTAGTSGTQASISDLRKSTYDKPNEMSSDIEFEDFEIGNTDGENLAVRLGYARTTDSGNTFGVNYYFNKLSFDNTNNDFTNHTINFFGEKNFSRSGNSEKVMGGMLNALIFDDDLSADNGFAGAFYFAYRRFMDNGALISAGMMLQAAVVGDLYTGYGNFAFLWGMPIASRFAINLDVLYTNVVYQEFDGNEIDIDDSDFFHGGFIFDFYVTESFGLNLGAKKVFALDNYESLELTLGGGIRF